MLTIYTSFLRYGSLYGVMSLWSKTVITNLISTIPCIRYDSVGLNNTLVVLGNYDKLPFVLYFKDLITVFLSVVVLSVFVFLTPNVLDCSDN